jgi:hypothetical protein
MIGELQLTTVLFIGGLLWLLLLLLDGVAIHLSWLRQWSDVVPILLVMIGVFDKWLWKWPFINRWLARRPIIAGTWHVLITPTAGDASITAYMVVRQTFARLSMRLLTPESQSELLSGTVIRTHDDLYQVVGLYTNRPTLAVRDRSPIHHGAFVLDVHGDPPTELDGSYWTDRGTRGSMVLNARRSQVFPTYDNAARTG